MDPEELDAITQENTEPGENTGITDTPNEQGENEREVAEPAPQEQPAQSPEERAVFAARRREREAQTIAQARIDAHFRALYAGQTNPYTGTPITDEASFLAYQKQYERDRKAAADGVSVEQYERMTEELRRSILESDPEIRQKDRLLEAFRQKEHAATLSNDLQAIKTAYPDERAGSVAELGEEFLTIMASGRVSPIAAYEAVRAERKRKGTPPPSMGSVGVTGRDRSEFYTREELDRMSPSQVHKNYDKVRKSMEKLNG